MRYQIYEAKSVKHDAQQRMGVTVRRERMEAAGRAPFRRERTHALAVCEIQSCKSHGDDLAASARQSPAALV